MERLFTQKYKMIKLIKSNIEKLVSSFDTVTTNAFSARKLSAFWFVVLTTYLEIQFISSSLLVEIVTINIILILLLLGIITFEQIIKFKGGDDKAKQTDNNNNNSDLTTP